MPDINQILAQWMEKHGVVQGAPFAIDPTVKSTDRNGDTVESPNPDPVYRYTFSDGSVLEMNGSGQIQKADEKPPKAPAGQTVNDPRTGEPIAVTTPSGGTVSLPRSANSDRPNYRTYTARDGTVYEYWEGHLPTVLKDAQGNAIQGAVSGAAAAKPPSDPSRWQQIHENPSDPNSRVVALLDPSTGERQSVTADASPSKPTVIQGQGGAMYSWDGSTLKPLIPANPDAPTTKEFNGTLYQWNPTTKHWDEAIAGAEKPKQGQTQPAIQDGYHVTQTWNGTQWVTTSVGERAVPQAPTTVSAPANQQYIVQETPGQAGVSTIENPNYVAQDVAGRVQQLQKLAQTKRDELNKAVQSGAKTKEEAATEFDAWWASNIEPQAQQLTQQQQQVQSEEQRKQEVEERSNLSTAQTAGRDAVAAAQAGLPYRVGPGFSTAVNQIANAFASGKPAGNLDIGSAVTFDMPDFQSIAQKATADALAHLSPTAAGISGRPMPSVPQGVDVRGALNKSNYAPTTTISPDGTVTITHSQSTPYQGAPNPSVFGSGMGAYVPPSLAPAAPPPPLAPNEQRLFG